MANRRTIAALLMSAVVATACRDTVAPSSRAVPEVRYSRVKGRPATGWEDGGVKLGQCFLQLGISAPQMTPPPTGATAVTAPTGQVITRVSIKGGATCHISPENATGNWTVALAGAPCYVVAGLGTQIASVARVGSGSSCPEMGTLQYLVGTPSSGGGDTGGGDTGGGDTGGGDTGGGGTGPGALVICADVSRPTGMEWYFDYDIGLLTSLAVREGTCSSPMTLDAGDYEVAERVSTDVPLSSVTSDPAGRVLSFSLATGVSTVKIVAGSTTTVRFGHVLP